MGRFFDWLSNLRPRQLLALAGISAILMFLIMFAVLNFLLKPAVTIPDDPDNPEITEDNEGKNKKDKEIKMKTVVVAAKNIEPKSMLISRLLETQEFPEDSLPPDAVTDIAEIANKPARERIFKGDVITRNKVYQNAAQAGFVGSIPPDCRAVSIGVSDVTGVAGFAKPGDYVDILLIERDNETVTSRLLMQDVLLLSINKNMGVRRNSEEEEEKESSVNPETTAIDNPALATFALRPEEILELVAASRLGEIYLMLRPIVPQSDYITGAEYTMHSFKSQRPAKEISSTISQEPTTPTVENNTPVAEKPVAEKPERIKIFYGDEIELKDVNNREFIQSDADKNLRQE